MNHKSLIFSYLVSLFVVLPPLLLAESPQVSSYPAYYNPARGFKPAQGDLTQIFLQLAASLEVESSPEPWIRHVLAEEKRIAVKYKTAKGKEIQPRPQYLTDKYIENVLGNWNKLSGGLKLDSLSRDSGRNIRYALMGSWNISPDELASMETALDENERSNFLDLVQKPYFTKADLPAVNAFYKSTFDKLTDVGKAMISKRTKRGMMEPDKRDADIRNDQKGSVAVATLNRFHKEYLDYLTGHSSKAVDSGTLFNYLKADLKLDQDKPNLANLDEYYYDPIFYSHNVKTGFTKRFAYLHKAADNETEAANTEKAVGAMIEDLAAFAVLELKLSLYENEIK